MIRRPLARACGAAALAAVVLAPAASRISAQQGGGAPPVSRDPQMTGAPVQGTGVIAGTVVAADTGKPVRRARVNLSAIQPRYAKSVTADDQGRFSFTDLTAGEYDLSSVKPGFLDTAYGQRKPGPGQSGVAIRLADRMHLETLKIPMPRGGVITGTVVDDLGDAVYGTDVRVFRYVMRTGERTLQSLGTGQTDDRGIFRIAGLPPGEYVVMASPRGDASEAARVEELKTQLESVAAQARMAGANADAAMAQMKGAMGAPPAADSGPTTGYAPVDLPGTTIAANATSVTLGPSEERGAVNLQLSLVPLARVAGIVSGVQGLAAGTTLQLVDPAQALPGLNVRSARTGVDGKFTFTGVPPGQYMLAARLDARSAADKAFADGMKAALEVRRPDGSMLVPPPPAPAATSETMWATADVTVDGRPINLDLSLRPGMSATGALTFDGAAPRPPDLTRVRVALLQIGATGAGETLVSADANGRFKATGLPPGRYRVQVIGATGWRLTSALANGREALDSSLEIKPGEDIGLLALTLSDKSQTLSGTVTDNTGAPATDYTIVAFPVDQRFWTPQSRRILSTRPTNDGRYTLRDLPPGDYRLAAVLDPEPGQWFDPAFLRQLVGASLPFSLGAGEGKGQDLRVK